MKTLIDSYIPVDHSPDPVIEAYKKDVDVTLIDLALSWTAEQRMQALINMAELRDEFLRRPKRGSSGVTDYGGLLRTLSEGGVEFIVTGEVAGVAHVPLG